MEGGKGPGEVDDSYFGRGIGYETRTGIKGLDRPGVNNGSALFHVRQDRHAVTAKRTVLTNGWLNRIGASQCRRHWQTNQIVKNQN